MLKELCRVRFAPSPTGNLHLGSLRTALFNYLLARKKNGVFALRIEDTDRTRLVPGCADQFERLLFNYGLNVDESPRLGGPYGPYKQSERLHIYRFYVDMLLDSGHAYPCFCSEQRLDLIRRNAMRERSNARYDGRCRVLSREEVSIRLTDGQPHVIRFKFDRGDVVVPDTVFGDNAHHVDEGDFVVIKSDGFPTYHFANVVDDHAMQFTHIVRGAEWLNSTPKHIRLYEAFGWRQPVWVHLPLITRPDGRKLSKRDADAFVHYYSRDCGYLPLAVLNFLIRNGSGLHDFDPDRLYGLDEMVERFDETLITRNNFMMDDNSLHKYGRLTFRGADFHSLVYPVIVERLRDHFHRHAIPIDERRLTPDYVRRVVDFLLRSEESFDRLALLVDGRFGFFFHWPLEETAEKIVSKFPADVARQWLSIILRQEFPTGWQHGALRQLAEREADNDGGDGMNGRKLSALLRTTLTGELSGPPIAELLNFLSEAECRHRLEATVTQLKAEETRPRVEGNRKNNF